VEVGFYATLRPIVGGARVEVPLGRGATLAQLLDELARRWPALCEHLFDEQGALSRRVNVFIDGRNVRWLPEQAATRLGAGQQVDIFPPVAGG